jgi:hypothetical protein
MTGNMSVCKVAVVLSVFNYTRFLFREIFEKKNNWNVKVNENSSSGSRVVLWVQTQGTDRRGEDNRSFSQNCEKLLRKKKPCSFTVGTISALLKAYLNSKKGKTHALLM